MIAALLLQAAVADGSTLGALPRQDLPARGCAAYLWSVGAEHRLVARAGTDPAELRVVLDGKPVDLPLLSAVGSAGLGFAATTRFGAGDVTATLDLAVETRADLVGGGAVPAATVTVERAGRDGVVVPVGGLVACAAPLKSH